MSKHMQLKVSVSPYYEKDLEGTYPGLVRHLRHLDAGLSDRNPSLFELAEKLDSLLYQFDGTKVREVLLKHKDPLKKLVKDIQENIADWNLAQADKLLYRIEDIFDAIEAELD